jgi:hypothetical protein
MIKNSKKKPAILVVCAPFFSYHESIIDELESRGLGVVWWSDRISENSLYKILLRCFPAIVAKLSSGSFASKVNLLEAKFIRDVLVVKGEGLSVAAIKVLRNSMPEARFHFYLWDGIENVRNAAKIAPLFDTVSSFDPEDSKRFGWHYRPLFASNAWVVPQVANDRGEHDWVFIGSLHSDRYKILKRLVLNSSHLRSFVYGFIPGKLAWWLRHLTDWTLWQPGTIKISTVPLTPNMVREIVDKARAAIDIEHPRQRGLTMRTIETLMSHRKLITTNSRIRDTDLFDESRVCIIDRNNPVIPEDFLNTPFLPLASSIRERYSITGWANEILDHANSPMARVFEKSPDRN